jgi:hypothetical protein
MTRLRKSIEYAAAMPTSRPPEVPWPRTEYKSKML